MYLFNKLFVCNGLDVSCLWCLDCLDVGRG